jgi:hypothetical protein
MNERAQVPALMVGGAISAIIPQSIEETWRLSTMIVEAGLGAAGSRRQGAGRERHARYLEPLGQEGTSAVAIVIMSGAELGLPPMVALRSFTVIGGKPALYGDGLINVVRSRGRAKSLELGYLRDATKEALLNLGLHKDVVAQMNTVDERYHRLVQGGAQRHRRDEGRGLSRWLTPSEAGLWDERPTRRGKVWKDGKAGMGRCPQRRIHGFVIPKRMKQWRAAGFCLRELFGDVLGGIRDEFEAREIAGETDRAHTTNRCTHGEAHPAIATQAAEPGCADRHRHDSRQRLRQGYGWRARRRGSCPRRSSRSPPTTAKARLSITASSSRISS